MNTIQYDIVICLGPNDYSLLPKLVENIKDNILNHHTIYIITPKSIIDILLSHNLSVTFIDESIFPFNIQYINILYNTPKRSGWYLQQLIKLYAPIIITELYDNYLILDADVYFHRPITFFENNKIQFNTGREYHIPYFEHMVKVYPSLKKIYNESGICHLMPMKHKIAKSFIQMIEEYHSGKSAWKVILDCVSPNDYDKSGASEYEMLFTYTLQKFPDEYEIRPLKWQNTTHIHHGYDGIYEACHWYMRK